MVSQAELISKGYHSLIPGLISVFLEMVWVSLTVFNTGIRTKLDHILAFSTGCCVIIPFIRKFYFFIYFLVMYNSQDCRNEAFQMFSSVYFYLIKGMYIPI